jgi:hypothetical protein
VEIVDRRLVRKGNVTISQILVRWAHMPDTCTTWEDYYVLKNRYPAASLWETELQAGASAEEGEIVMPSILMDDNQSPAELASSPGPASEKNDQVVG